ncbi:hypothetical protein M9458_054286 [Cirrhinus mrigala]|uniref:Uncharacterized protein n=1 Tax=Cirrhinus mrigala TaxID=683832 RepID=A0ABD0MKR5_CIRMR
MKELGLRLNARKKNHLSGNGVGFDHDAGIRSSRQSRHCVQRNTFWPAVHETPAVVTQNQGVFHKGKPTSHGQGHAALPTCRRHVEKALVMVSGPGVGDMLSSLGHEWLLSPWSVEQPPSHVVHLCLEMLAVLSCFLDTCRLGRNSARSAVPCQSSVSGHRASRSKYTRGLSQKTDSLSRPSDSAYFCQKCLNGIQFGFPASILRGHFHLEAPEQALVMEQEVIQVVPPIDGKSRFYSRYFTVPKKDEQATCQSLGETPPERVALIWRFELLLDWLLSYRTRRGFVCTSLCSWGKEPYLDSAAPLLGFQVTSSPPSGSLPNTWLSEDTYVPLSVVCALQKDLQRSSFLLQRRKSLWYALGAKLLLAQSERLVVQH